PVEHHGGGGRGREGEGGAAADVRSANAPLVVRPSAGGEGHRLPGAGRWRGGRDHHHRGGVHRDVHRARWAAAPAGRGAHGVGPLAGKRDGGDARAGRGRTESVGARPAEGGARRPRSRKRQVLAHAQGDGAAHHRPGRRGRNREHRAGGTRAAGVGRRGHEGEVPRGREGDRTGVLRGGGSRASAVQVPEHGTDRCSAGIKGGGGRNGLALADTVQRVHLYFGRGPYGHRQHHRIGAAGIDRLQGDRVIPRAGEGELRLEAGRVAATGKGRRGAPAAGRACGGGQPVVACVAAVRAAARVVGGAHQGRAAGGGGKREGRLWRGLHADRAHQRIDAALIAGGARDGVGAGHGEGDPQGRGPG